ncbi:FAD-binding protein [Streptomyces sp. NPDC002838]|uniref:FAD-binding protein n=1 Tax=Streptomyces sp. NPDC002838 TaxID=3154436 RepID=UPI00332FE664
MRRRTGRRPVGDDGHRHVGPEGFTVRVQGGCTLADLDRATQRYRLTAPVGVVSATGIAGLALSGDTGCCDNLVSTGAREDTAEEGERALLPLLRSPSLSAA